MRAKSDHGRRRSETVETRDKNRDVRDLSEISRGEGGWKQREDHNFLRPQKREGS